MLVLFIIQFFALVLENQHRITFMASVFDENYSSQWIISCAIIEATTFISTWLTMDTVEP